MEITEIKQKKSDLERKICDLLGKFESDTKVEITDVNITFENKTYENGMVRSKTINMKITIEL